MSASPVKKTQEEQRDIQVSGRNVGQGDHSPDLAAAIAASVLTLKLEEETRALSASPVKRKEEDHREGTPPPAAAGKNLRWGMPEDAPLVYDDSVSREMPEPSPGTSQQGAHAPERNDMIELFVNAVTAKYDKASLREIIREAHKSGVPDVVNAVCYRDKGDGRTPLAYAVVKNLERVVRDLVDLGANVNAKMGEHTVLTLAATNKLRDSTAMFRLLLSLGANPSSIADAGLEIAQLNRTMKYWLARSKENPPPSEMVRQHLARMPPMHRLHEITYALIGQGAAIAMVEEELSSRFGNPQARKSPLVMLLLGPPGHGKTCISRNLAKSLVGEDNFIEVTRFQLWLSQSLQVLVQPQDPDV